MSERAINEVTNLHLRRVTMIDLHGGGGGSVAVAALAADAAAAAVGCSVGLMLASSSM